MNVSYAKKWQKEIAKLRQIALDCDLTAERKWSNPQFKRQFKALTPGRQKVTYFTSPSQSKPGRGPRRSRNRCLRLSEDEGACSGG
jgi:uncharacterized protein YdeI (YjbR/CyaY-like superfamily)